MSFDADLLRAIASLTFGLASFPFSILFITMFFAGRVITEESDRSPLGTQAGWFFLMVGIVFLMVALLSVGTWHDLEPDRDFPEWLATAANLVGVFCIVVGIVLAIRIGPILLKYIRIVWKLEREGRL